MKKTIVLVFLILSACSQKSDSTPSNESRNEKAVVNSNSATLKVRIGADEESTSYSFSNKSDNTESVRCMIYQNQSIPFFKLRISKGKPGVAPDFTDVSSCSEGCVDMDIKLSNLEPLETRQSVSGIYNRLEIFMINEGRSVGMLEDKTECSVSTLQKDEYKIECKDLQHYSSHKLHFEIVLHCVIEQKQ